MVFRRRYFRERHIKYGTAEGSAKEGEVKDTVFELWKSELASIEAKLTSSKSDSDSGSTYSASSY
ncbi:hypothetical protein HPB48_021949 [Haemaphysalis longicornis]|uniref:Uncharacterized protein n=1 Tax=Haemaphysalis longicornis TaxID=44386 RepID=A0A9J6GN54_HAELO|nr:hypothetical protein HPB48_021949 [Haemaphysalis longicornis]